ncbi:hypothetical protein A0H81_03073 [Grifola frondosa]|uniref:Uncharacterized protein n=1 Tax=Grifola frondosa TaxID=5627 RepID=A0A1C7MJ42_GRIFR|nr:hypothetical protein A0H81_03073 [Grifola frondosa]
MKAADTRTDFADCFFKNQYETYPIMCIVLRYIFVFELIRPPFSCKLENYTPISDPKSPLSGFPITLMFVNSKGYINVYQSHRLTQGRESADPPF